MNDDVFAAVFERCEIPTDAFHHRDHIRLAWIYVRRYGLPEAERRIAESICRYAAHHGASRKYHQTITIAWMRVVARAMRRAPDATFEGLAEKFPHLLDKGSLAEFYSSAVLQSDAARVGWVEPDLQPL